jgi:hypothetical protein
MFEHLMLQPQQQQIFTFPVGLALGALLCGIIIEYYGHKRGLKENKIKAYSRLKGQGFLLCALYKSYGYAFLESQQANETSQKNWEKIKDKENAEETFTNSQAYRQYEKAYQRSQELYVDLAKNEREFWEIIGTIEILFPGTKSLISLIELALKRYEISEWSKMPQPKDLINNFLVNQFTPPLENLSTYLKGEIE